LAYCHTSTLHVCGQGWQSFLTQAIEATILPFPNPSEKFLLLDFLLRQVGSEFQVEIELAKQAAWKSLFNSVNADTNAGVMA